MKKILLAFFTFFSLFLSAQQRIVLIEQFTNSGCPPCATSTPTVLNYVDANPADVVAIAYHTSFPYNDSMYFENPVEATTRTSFYSVAGVPYSVVDGNYYSNGSPAFISVMASTINARKTMAPQYSISAVSNTVTGNLLNTQLSFSSLLAGNVNDSLRAFIVVIEKTVLKSAYAASPGANSETQYEYVMRKMISSDSGAYLQNRNFAGTDLFNINWNLSKIKDVNEVRIIAFVQNRNTKEVYNAAMFSPSVFASLPENQTASGITVYPNPTSSCIYVAPGNSFSDGIIELHDLSGRYIYSESIENKTLIEINTASFEKGLYIIQLKNGKNAASKKIIIN
ncbi:MAG TPA: T9SS type A sorting domain-containing protein [Bacteroidia bacterium]|jgi:thiol-disulfide isomerase/thioredoxin